jgi:hypothetical protein
VKLRRRGIGTELNTGYFLDGVKYVQAAVEQMATPSLFDFLEQPDDEAVESVAS